MQNIVCNTKSIMFVTVITIPCKTIRKKKNDNKKKVMQKFLEFFYHLTCVSVHPSFFKMSGTLRFQISRVHPCSSTGEASQFHGVSVEPSGIVASAFSMLAHPTHHLYTHHGVYGGIACSAPWQSYTNWGEEELIYTAHKG